jgi:diguanylate cyclase (GGDEF)-like protein
MRLLIVSDEGEVRSSLLEILQTNGYPPPLFASSCAEALAILSLGQQGDKDIPVDVILVDADLPGDAGLELCRRFEEVPCLEDIPRLLMTGQPATVALDSARAAGAGDFVRKPVQAPELLGRLHAACRLKRHLDACRQHTRELQRLNGELQHLSVIDELTGVANRRSFNRVMAHEWARAAREAAPLSLLMIDIDSFKAYNDHYGHQSGDECLRRVAAALTGAARRPGDHVARYGGEEFTVLLPQTGGPGALTVAESLRAAVEGLNLPHARSPSHGRVTISVGVASTLPERRGCSDSLVAAADRAMYEAKSDGRNCVRSYTGPLVHVHPAHDETRPAQPPRTPRADATDSDEESTEATPGRAGDHQE